MTSDLIPEDFEERVLKASKKELQELISKASLSCNSDSLTEVLIRLHNENQIDIITVFSEIRQEPSSGAHFFQKRRIFEAILPNLNADIAKVMDCVLHLIEEAGEDLSANVVLQPFADYCSANPSRPSRGLELVEESPELYVPLILPILIAGSQLEFTFYFDSTLRLINCENIEIRKSAVLALGRLQYQDNTDFPDIALGSLEILLEKETDDITLANLIDSAARFYKYEVPLQPRINQAIDTALLKGGDFALNTASNLFGLRNEELPENAINIILKHLQNVNPYHKLSLDNIDYGIASLVEKDGQNKTIEFLEQILLKSKGEISLSTFDSTCYKILENKENIFSRIVTKWLLSGKSQLCKAIFDIVSLPYGDDLIISIDPSEIDISNYNEIYFLARKAIGYLFFKPISAASIIVSLIKVVSEDEIFQALSELLFDPLLINYPGQVRNYLDQQIQTTISSPLKEALQAAVNSLESYVADLNTVSTIPEIHPPQRNIDAYNLRFQKQCSEYMTQAEKSSALFSILPKSLLLYYGNKSIDYVYAYNSEVKRVETPLKKLGDGEKISISIPSLTLIDPLGLDYMLRMFQVEQLNKNETDKPRLG